MKLTLISSITEDYRDLRYFLKSLTEQDNQDFEIILCLNKSSNNKRIFDVIQEHYEFFGSRLKFLVNSRRESIQYTLANAFALAKGEYVTVLNSDTTIKKYLVREISTYASDLDVDILEFKPRMIGSIAWKPHPRIQNVNTRIKIADSPDIIAYSFPFIFNKIYKKSLIKKLIKFKPSTVTDTKLAIELNYRLLLLAKTYSYIDIRIKREYFGVDNWINPHSFITKFDALEPFFKTSDRKLMHEFNYAKYFFIKIFLAGLLTDTNYRNINTIMNYKQVLEKRSHKFKDKLKEIIKKYESSNEYKIFCETNIYMQFDNTETNWLRNSNPINKWNKILGELE